MSAVSTEQPNVAYDNPNLQQAQEQEQEKEQHQESVYEVAEGIDNVGDIFGAFSDLQTTVDQQPVQPDVGIPDFDQEETWQVKAASIVNGDKFYIDDDFVLQCKELEPLNDYQVIYNDLQTLTTRVINLVTNENGIISKWQHAEYDASVDAMANFKPTLIDGEQIQSLDPETLSPLTKNVGSEPVTEGLHSAVNMASPSSPTAMGEQIIQQPFVQGGVQAGTPIANAVVEQPVRLISALGHLVASAANAGAQGFGALGDTIGAWRQQRTIAGLSDGPREADFSGMEAPWEKASAAFDSHYDAVVDHLDDLEMGEAVEPSVIQKKLDDTLQAFTDLYESVPLTDEGEEMVEKKAKMLLDLGERLQASGFDFEWVKQFAEKVKELLQRFIPDWLKRSGSSAEVTTSMSPS